VVGKNAFIGANCVVTTSPGRTVSIGDGAVVAAGSVISADVPACTLVGIEKAKPLAILTVPLTMRTSYAQFLAGIRPLNKSSKS
jgi:tetrahydrodipicolinate N-succinyltransferase